MTVIVLLTVMTVIVLFTVILVLALHCFERYTFFHLYYSLNRDLF